MKREELEAVTEGNPLKFRIKGIDKDFEFIRFGNTCGIFEIGKYERKYACSANLFEKGISWFCFHAFGRQLKGVIKYSNILPIQILETEKQLAT